MDWKKMVSGCVITSMLAVPMLSCETMDNNRTATGAVIGTVAGAALGAGVGAMASGKHKGRGIAWGAGAGAVAGGLIGAGVGYYLQKKKEQLQQVQNVQVTEVPAAPATNGAPPVAEHLVLNINSQFLFEVGSSTLSPAGIVKVQEIARVLNQDPNTRVLVKGHTSSEGGDAYNQALSDRRAYAVKNCLVAERIEPGRITAVGLGSSLPVASNDTESGRMLNRRVEIEIFQR